MRIAIGGISHETNQYVPRPTDMSSFEIHRGSEIFARHGGRSYIGGMLQAGRRLRHEVLGTYHAIAQPGGVIRTEAFSRMLDDLLVEIDGVLPVDAIVLELHGAGVSESTTDLEGEVASAVRRLVGPEIPLVAAHDLHANLSWAEVSTMDALLSVQQYPHDDIFECGGRAVGIADAIVRGELKPTVHLERLPLLIPPTSTYAGAGRAAHLVCAALEQAPGVVHCTFLHGFPYADHADVGASVLVVSNDDPALAREVACEAARRIWSMRAEFTPDFLRPAEAVAKARSLPSEAGPVVINETSDNPGGGAPGDGTRLLAALLTSGITDGVFVGIKDPEVVRAAHRAGVGATISVDLGGKTDQLHGDPIPCSAYIKVLTDGDIPIEAPILRGSSWPLGLTARLVIEGLDVIVFTEGIQTFDRTPLLLHGIDPQTCSLVALKSAQHFRSGFQSMAREIITVDSGGLTSLDVASFPRSHLRVTPFPLDPSVTYQASRGVQPSNAAE